MSKVRHCPKVEYTQKGNALWECILSVWAQLWAVSPPVFVVSLFFVPCRVQQSGTEDLPKINLSSSVRLGHEETGSYKCKKHNHAHGHTTPTTPTEGQTPIPISPVTLHSITAKAEPQNWGQTSKRKSPSPRAQRAVTNFPHSWINESELSSRQLQNAHTREFVHTDVTTHM